MSAYFSAFPSTSYSGTTIKNIVLRASIVKNFSQNANNFYPYTIKDGETADSLAYDYYGDPNYMWIIYLVNNIIDPYYGWPLGTVDFERYITDKYGSLAIAKQTTVYYKKKAVDYYVNELTNEFVLASSYNPTINGYGWKLVTIDDDVKINSITNPDPSVWQAVDAYTDELEQNEKKRYIRLLDNSYVTAINQQLKDVLNG